MRANRTVDLVYKHQTSKLLLQRSNPKTLRSSNFVVHCNVLITQNGRNGNIQEAESIFNRMPHKTTVSWTAMLTAYSQNGKMEKARKVFEEMPERTSSSYNAMITACVKNRSIEEACNLFRDMPQRNPVSYAAMITGLVRFAEFDRAEELHRAMPMEWRDPVSSNALISGYLRVGRLEEAVRVFEGMGERDVVSWSSMVDGYCKVGMIVDARRLFDEIPEKNVFTWTSMINGYMTVGCFEDGFGMFSDMRREGLVGLNSNTLTVMFEACGSLGRNQEGIQMHGLVLRMGFEFDVFLGNSIITMYCRFGCTDPAKEVFHLMKKKDVVSWNSMISGHIQGDEIEEAYRLFVQMPSKDVVSWTTMIKGFSSKGQTDKSVHLFTMMPEKDDIAWTALISGLVDNGEHEEAFRWFIEMLRAKVTPNPVTFSSLLSASAGLATLNQGLQVHTQVLKTNMRSDLSVQNSLVTMYSKCGNVDDAYGVYRSISRPNVVSFNSMITGFAHNGFAEKALDLFIKMQSEEGTEPNRVTFLAVLSACAHDGLVELGLKYFKAMKASYGIEPEPDHYTCMVDLFGRAGLLDKAISFIRSMPSEGHAGVWGALLGASKAHLRLDLAELAAQKLMELEPDSATSYVVLSQLYSVMGKTKKGNQVRDSQKFKGIKKSPGCSWIVVQDKTHLFVAGDDRPHMNLVDIKFMLQVLAKEMEVSHLYHQGFT